MSNEGKRNSGVQIGTLGGCLIEGDSEQKARERKIKRRALAISIALQSLVLVGLVLTPLLGKTEKLPFTIVTPMPPYHAPRVRPEAQPQPPIRGERSVCLVCFNHPLSPTPITTDNHRLTPYVSGDEVTIGIPGSGEPTGSDIFNTRSGPVAPEDPPHAALRVSRYLEEIELRTPDGSVRVPSHHVRFSVWIEDRAVCAVSIPDDEAEELAEFLMAWVPRSTDPGQRIEA
jgi:hypothetical protein